MTKPSKSYEDGLMARLQDDDFAREYLSACFDDPEPALFVQALRDVIKARNINQTQLAKDCNISRASLLQATNPSFASVVALADALGFQFLLRSKPTVRTVISATGRKMKLKSHGVFTPGAKGKPTAQQA